MVAFDRGGHEIPQAPQFERLVLVLISHPSEVRPLQSSYAPMHMYTHVPLVQLVVVLSRVSHTVPHDPQLVTLDCVSASQPSVAEPLQSWYGALQVYAQVPDMHVRVAFAGIGQPFVHMPQWDGLESVLISHPSPASPLQSA